MKNPILITAMLGLALLLISLEWNKIRKMDLKTILTILIILFFLGSALIPLFSY